MGQNRLGEKNIHESLIARNWILIFILFLAILGIYYPTLHHPFINLDDYDYVIDNSYIRDLTWTGIYKIFSQPIVGNYFPLQILSYAVDYKLWHIHPFGYHLHNVVLHILNAILVFLLLKKIFPNPWVAFFSALFFALHPVNVESVTWVAERKNVLSLALILCSFLSYIYYLEEQRPARRRGFYLFALFLFLMGLLAKVASVVLPILLLLFDFCFRKRTKWEMVKDKVPFLILSFIFSLITIWVYHSLHDMPDFHGGSSYTNFLAMINVFVEYIIYLIIPLYLDHYYRTTIPQTIFESQVLLSLAAILLVAFLAWRSFRRDRTFFFWSAWFLISLLPVLNIVPIAILRADRYMYLSAIGFFYLISLGLMKIGQAGYRPVRFPALLFAVFWVAGSYAFLTTERNKLWKDYVSLWEDNLKKFPQSVAAYNSLGHAYIDKGNLDKAFSYFQTGLRESPNEVTLLNGLAIAYKTKGDLTKAREILFQADRIRPNDSVIYSNLGLIYLYRGEMEKAKEYFQRAIELDPKRSHAAHTNLSLVFSNLNRLEEGISELEKAIELSPSSMPAYLNLAVIYNRKKSWEKAEFYLRKGLDYVPWSHDGLLMLGRICWEQGKIQEAKYYLYKAQRLKPNDGETHYFLGLIAQREENGSLAKQKEALPPAQFQAMEALKKKSQGHRNL